MRMEDEHKVLVVFNLEERLFALHLEAVERVIRACAVLPMPKAPEIIIGVINLQGRIVPVADIRKRFGMTERELEPEDHIIIAHTQRRSVALPVESVHGIRDVSSRDITNPERIIPGLEYVQGVARLDDGMILIHDVDKFLSLEEEEQLDNALNEPVPDME